MFLVSQEVRGFGSNYTSCVYCKCWKDNSNYFRALSCIEIAFLIL